MGIRNRWRRVKRGAALPERPLGTFTTERERGSWYVPNGIRTRVLALKGPRPGPLDDGDVRRSARILSMIARPPRAEVALHHARRGGPTPRRPCHTASTVTSTARGTQ